MSLTVVKFVMIMKSVRPSRAHLLGRAREGLDVCVATVLFSWMLFRLRSARAVATADQTKVQMKAKPV